MKHILYILILAVTIASVKTYGYTPEDTVTHGNDSTSDTATDPYYSNPSIAPTTTQNTDDDRGTTAYDDSHTNSNHTADAQTDGQGSSRAEVQGDNGDITRDSQVAGEDTMNQSANDAAVVASANDRATVTKLLTEIDDATFGAQTAKIGSAQEASTCGGFIALPCITASQAASQAAVEAASQTASQTAASANSATMALWQQAVDQQLYMTMLIQQNALAPK